MSIYIMMPVFETTKLTSSEKLVALFLADNAHDDGTSAYPSVSTTAAKTALSERTIQRILQSLVAKKIIAVQKEATNNFPTTYLFLLSPDRKYLAVDWPGGVVVSPPDELGVTLTTDRGDIDDSLGCHDVTQTINEPLIEPIKKKGRPRKNPEPKYTPEFEEFYSLYPKPLNKEQTFKNWVWSTTTKGAKSADIVAALSSYLKEIERKGTDPDFIIRSTNFVGQKQRWIEYQVLNIDAVTLDQAKVWEEYDSYIAQGWETNEPAFPRPKDSNGYLLDSSGRSYYIDPMDYKRRYVDDE